MRCYHSDINQYSHLDDEALVRHVQTDEIDSLVLELAERLESNLSDEKTQDEIEHLENDVGNLNDDLNNINYRVDKAEEYAVIIADRYGFRDDISYGFIDDTVSTLCDKINELMHVKNN